jgi:hypothetical protein
MLTLRSEGYNLLDITNIDINRMLISDVIKLDETTYCRMDMVAVAYYGDIKYLPLLLDYNSITDVEMMQIGDIIAIPELSDLLQYSENTSLFEEEEAGIFKCPGFVENNYTPQKNKSSKKGNLTMANSKLKIVQKESEYSPETGMIIF